MRILQAMAFGFVLVAGCGGDDDSDDGPIDGDGMTEREVIEEYSMSICQRAVDCQCGGPLEDVEGAFEECRQRWISNHCRPGFNCASIAPVTREEMDACISDTADISCDEPEMPESCNFLGAIELVCERSGLPTYGEVIEEYTMTICQRAVECSCGEHDGYDDCRQDWMDSYCSSGINCSGVADVTLEQMGDCKADSMVIPCDEPAMPASCDPLFPFGWNLSCEQE
jgi:hypothetical protein